MIRQLAPSVSKILRTLTKTDVLVNKSLKLAKNSAETARMFTSNLSPNFILAPNFMATSFACGTFRSQFHTSSYAQAKKLSLEELKRLEQGKTNFLGTRPRDDLPPLPRPLSQILVPGYGSGGGGQPPFTPTKELVKRKTYFKRCRFFLHCLEFEDAMKASQSREVPIPAFRVGDVVEIKLVEPDNNYKEGKFKGLVIKRVNRGLGSSFTLLNYNKDAGAYERNVPLYSPHFKSMTILERRKVNRGKLTYMKKERKVSEYTFK